MKSIFCRGHIALAVITVALSLQAADLPGPWSPDRANAWFKATGVLPADDRLDTSLITQPQLKQVYDWDTTVGGPNLENFIPSIMDEQANFAGVQLLFAGDSTPEELGQLTEDVNAKWREQNPDAAANFKAWIK